MPYSWSSQIINSRDASPLGTALRNTSLVLHKNEYGVRLMDIKNTKLRVGCHKIDNKRCLTSSNGINAFVSNHCLLYTPREHTIIMILLLSTTQARQYSTF